MAIEARLSREAQVQTPDALKQKLRDGLALHLQAKLAKAEKLYEEILAQNPNHFDALHLLGVISYQTRRPTRAVELISQAITINATFAEAHCNLGNALQELKRSEEALVSYDRAIELNPGYAMAYSNRGSALRDLKRLEEALASFGEAIALNPNDAMAHSNRGAALQELGRPEEAVASFDKAISLKPDHAEVHYNRGDALKDLKRLEEALASYDQAILLKPDYAEAYSNRGNILYELEQFNEALANYDHAVKLKPTYAMAYANSGNVLRRLRRHNEAADRYRSALALDPQYPFAKGMLLHEKMLCCDWRGIDKLISEIDSDIALGRLSAEPFGWQGISNSQRSLQLCAEIFNKAKFPPAAGVTPHRPQTNSKKIRIGYLSGEFRDQATSHLLVGLLEQHDKSLFEVYLFDNGWDDRSYLRNRINATADAIVNIKRLNDRSAASVIRDNEIDILINLNGYFGAERTGVFAQRGAPIQTNYLGFPGTLGAAYIDYIIADRHVIPEYHKIFYSEKIVYMPYCYQANDDRKEIEDYEFTRSETGLPEAVFVFCSFNNTYKITPEKFDIWMNILKKVDNSILWLRDLGVATDNLRKEAALRGVEANRLVFAPQMRLPDHLARHRLADLFLDTLPYNAHTTASDALWAGLPVLTQIGETFAGRVAASLLTAIGLPELITQSHQAYETLAIELATDPEKLAGIKSKLAANRLTAPLFNTELFARHIEAAYTIMYERYHAGLRPDHIAVEP